MRWLPSRGSLVITVERRRSPPHYNGLPPFPEMAAMSDDRLAETPRASTASASLQQRLKFSDFLFQRTPSGKVTCKVTLEFGVTEFTSGTIEGHTSPAGDIRLGAEAAIRALEIFTEGRIK